MKKFKLLILIFVVFLINSSVYGLEKKDISLVASDSVTSVITDTFNYNGVSLSKTDDEGSFSFQSITNNTNDKIPVSVNILLFDKNKVNIGFLTYCSENDISSDYSKFMLKPHESTSFSINITKKYFVSDKSLSDLSYYAILNENKYCHIGGYDKYAGLSFDEINDGMVSANKNKSDYEKIREMIINYNMNINKVLLIFIITVVVIFFIRGIILNSLYIRMYCKKSILSYLPISSSYVTVKLAFGSGVAAIYILLYLLAFPFSMFNKVAMLVSGFLSVFESISFIIVLVKLITGKYNLMGNSSKNEVEEEYRNNGNSSKSENILLDDDSDDSDNIDISYSNDNNSELSSDNMNSGFKNNDSNEEGSDLTNMFK